MPTTRVHDEAAPRAIGPYSQAILHRQPGTTTLWTAGQIALDPATMELVQGDIAAQTERVMQNLEAVLTAAGMSFSDVVKATVFLIDFADFASMNEVFGRRFTNGAPPARSTVQVAALPRGARVEIDLVAVKDEPAAAARKRTPPRAGTRSAGRQTAAEGKVKRAAAKRR